jgi:hypothetical protein
MNTEFFIYVKKDIHDLLVCFIVPVLVPENPNLVTAVINLKTNLDEHHKTVED